MKILAQRPTHISAVATVLLERERERGRHTDRQTDRLNDNLKEKRFYLFAAIDLNLKMYALLQVP